MLLLFTIKYKWDVIYLFICHCLLHFFLFFVLLLQNYCNIYLQKNTRKKVLNFVHLKKEKNLFTGLSGMELTFYGGGSGPFY